MIKKIVLNLILLSMVLTHAFAANRTKCTCLFNGKNLDGWHSYSVQKTNPDTALFHAENGILKASGKYQGYIVSKESFGKSFTITAEYRWNMDSTVARIKNKRNSGLQYLVPADAKDELWPKGIQFQIKENATGDFILLKEVTIKHNGTFTEAGKSVTAKRIKDVEKPVGEWNSIKVVFDHGHCKQYLNDTLVNEATEASIQEGRILILYEGFPIDFRNILVEKHK